MERNRMRAAGQIRIAPSFTRRAGAYARLPLIANGVCNCREKSQTSWEIKHGLVNGPLY